jgi:hypothetical protein
MCDHVIVILISTRSTAMLENLLENLFGKNYEYGEQSLIINSNVSTRSTEIPGNCTFYGTSNLTIQLTELDNQVKIQCVEESKSCHCHINFNTLGISDGSQISTHTADEHTPRSQVEDALSIGGYHGTKQKA